MYKMNNPRKQKNKGNSRVTQIKTIFNFLQKREATASMVEVKKNYCKITRFLTWYLTTDPRKFTKSNQTKLF